MMWVLLIFGAQMVVMAVLLCLTGYALLRGVISTFALATLLKEEGYQGLGNAVFALAWSWTPPVQVVLALHGHGLESWGISLGRKNGVATLPLLLAFSPWIMFWIVGILPAIRDGWNLMAGWSQAERIAVMGGSFLLVALTALMQRAM